MATAGDDFEKGVAAGLLFGIATWLAVLPR
jgi:hypothetical protein